MADTDVVVTINEEGLNEALRELIRWKYVDLFPYKIHGERDVQVPPLPTTLTLTLDAVLQIPYAALHNHLSDQYVEAVFNGTLDITATNYPPEHADIQIIASFSYIVQSDMTGLKFRNLTAQVISSGNPPQVGSLLDLLNSYPDVLSSVMQNDPSLSKFFDVIPLFSPTAFDFGTPTNMLEINIRNLTLLEDFEGFTMGDNEVQIRGVICLDDGTKDGKELAKFGVPFFDDMKEGETRAINQRILIPEPEIGQLVNIKVEGWEIDDWGRGTWDALGKFTVVFTPADLHERGRGFSIKGPRTMFYEWTGHQFRFHGTRDIMPGEELLCRSMGSSFTFTMTLNRLQRTTPKFVILGESQIAEPQDLVPLGVIHKPGSVSFGFLIEPPEQTYRFTAQQVWVKPDAINTVIRAIDDFVIELMIGDQRLSLQTPLQPGVPFDLVPSQFSTRIRPFAGSGYTLRVSYNYTDTDPESGSQTQKGELISELHQELWVEAPYHNLPALGTLQNENDKIGIQYTVTIEQGTGIPLTPIQADEQLAMTISERAISRAIASYRTLIPEFVAEIGDTCSVLLRQLDLPTIRFKSANGGSIAMSLPVRASGYVYPIQGFLLEGSFDIPYTLEAETWPKLQEDGYRTHLLAQRSTSNIEGLLAKALENWYDHLSFFEHLIFAIPVFVLGGLLEISKYFINLDEITKPLRDDLEDARSGIGDSPEDFPGADAGGFRIGVRPVRMQIGDGVIQFGCIFQPSFGGGVFGKYGPTHVTIGVDSTNSPLAISPPDSEQSRVRAHLLEWMEFTNLEFELVPMSLRPWIKVVWEYDSEFPESVASTEGFWDNGVRIRLNPNLSWRTVDDIPSFQPDGTSYAYDFYVTHSLGHALGIRGELNPAIQDGAVMLPITDPGRYDYRLRPRDVRAVQDTFGARPIPFQPQVLDATQLEAAMKNALQAVGDDHVTYRMDEKQRIAEGRKAFSASLSATLDGIWFHAHEDSGKSEYQVETIIGVCGKNTSLKQNWLSGIKDEQGTIALEHPPVTITADLNVMRDIIGRNAGEDLWVFLHVNVLGIDNPSVGDSHDPWGSWDGEIREAAHNGGRIVPFSVPFREALNGNTPAGAYFEAYFSKAIVLAHFKSVANLSFRFQVPTALWPFHIAETARYAQEQALQAALPDAIYLPVEESAP